MSHGDSKRRPNKAEAQEERTQDTRDGAFCTPRDWAFGAWMTSASFHLQSSIKRPAGRQAGELGVGEEPDTPHGS